MGRPAAASLLAIPLLIFDAWGVEPRPVCVDEAAVREVVQGYFDGMIEGDPEKLRAAFHPEAFLIGQGRDGQIMRIPFERWSAGMNRPRENPRAYRNEIADVDITGNAAVVKTVLTWPSVKYVDYLSLLRNRDGEWRIVNKIWDETDV